MAKQKCKLIPIDSIDYLMQELLFIKLTLKNTKTNDSYERIENLEKYIQKIFLKEDEEYLNTIKKFIYEMMKITKNSGDIDSNKHYHSLYEELKFKGIHGIEEVMEKL